MEIFVVFLMEVNLNQNYLSPSLRNSGNEAFSFFPFIVSTSETSGGVTSGDENKPASPSSSTTSSSDKPGEIS